MKKSIRLLVTTILLVSSLVEAASNIGGKLKITVDAFGEEEVEYDEWYLTSKGELIIGDDDEDEVWMLEGKKLYQYDKLSRGRLEKQEVFLVKR